MHPSATSGTVVPIPPKAPSNQAMERGGAPIPPQKPVAPQDLLDGGNVNVGRDSSDLLTDLLDNAAISPQPSSSGNLNGANPFDAFAQGRSLPAAQPLAPQVVNSQVQPTPTPPQGHRQITPPPQQLPQNAQAPPQLMTSPGAPFGASPGAYPPPQPMIHPNQGGTMPTIPNAPAFAHPPQSTGFPVHQQHGVQPGFMPTPQQQIQNPGQGAPQPPFQGQNVGAVPHPFGQQLVPPPPQYSGQPAPKPPQMNMNQFDPFAKK